jgi:hypothetical protein
MLAYRDLQILSGALFVMIKFLGEDLRLASSRTVEHNVNWGAIALCRVVTLDCIKSLYLVT